MPDEHVEGFVSCPGCGRLLRPGVETCPECGAAITPEYAAQSIEDNVTVAQAYSIAGRIESFNPAAFILLAVSVGGVLLNAFGPGASPNPLLLLGLIAFPMWALATILRWFRWFGSYESENVEFATARRKVKAALRLWLFVIAGLFIGLVAQLLIR